MSVSSSSGRAADAGVVRCTIEIRRQPGPDWDEFVAARPAASIYLRSGWSLLAEEVFGHRPYFIEARDADGVLRGVLPLVHQKSLLLGSFVTSVPFFNSGGALSDAPEIAAELMSTARSVAQELRCRYLELRDVEPRAGDWWVRTDKVAMVLELPESREELAKRLGAKLRSQIKRADREHPVVHFGGRELLGAFYDVFCRNMRDLGTPVYPRRFFEAVLDRFAELCRLVVVECAGRPAAAGFLVICADRAEIPWAACRRDAKPTGMNMRLYWEALCLALESGCKRFDFGRSTIDSGTYRFKKQWGAKPVQLHWHRWEWERGRPEFAASAPGGALRYATAVWRRLPLPVANALGPLLSPSLPW